MNALALATTEDFSGHSYVFPNQTIFPSKESYLAFRDAWKETYSTNRTALCAEHFAIYAALRDREWSKGFTPCTNPRKLANGQRKWQGLEKAMSMLNYAQARGNYSRLSSPFKGTISDDAIKEAIETILAESKKVVCG